MSRWMDSHMNSGHSQECSCIVVSFFIYLQLATGVCDMNKSLGADSNSWVITSDNSIKTNNETEYNLNQQIQEGDIIVSKKSVTKTLMTIFSYVISPPQNSYTT